MNHHLQRTVKPTVKKGGGNQSNGLGMYGCMAAKGVGWATRINGTMDSKLYLQVLKDEMAKSINWCV